MITINIVISIQRTVINRYKSVNDFIRIKNTIYEIKRIQEKYYQPSTVLNMVCGPFLQH